MANVIIRFQPERTQLTQALKDLDSDMKEFRDDQFDIVNEQTNRINQDLISVQRDQKIVRQINNAEYERIVELKSNLAVLKSEQDQIDSLNNATLGQYNRLTHQMKEATAEIEELENRTQQIEARVSGVNDSIRKASITVSSLLGFLSLATAISGGIQDQAISTILAVASSTISLATAYGALGAASGNWMMLAAAGAAASSAASIINTLRAIGQRNQLQADMDRRRGQTRKIGG